jgi:chromosome segregation ATPase
MAQEIKAHLNGPFDDIDHAMQRMIWKLKQEQTEENEHKEWCDKEESKTQIAKDDKDDKLQTAEEKLNMAKARIQKCTLEIAESHKLIDAISNHFGEAEMVRQAGHKENMEAIADAELAQKALSNAIAVMTDFYKGSGMVPKEAWEAFVQTANKALPDQPSTWEADYTGTLDPQSQPNGIIAVLEAVSADFAEMLADTKAQEEEDRNAYEKDISDNKIEQARRREYIKVKEAEKKRTIDKLGELQGEVDHRQKEVNAIVQYIEDLAHTCHGGDSTYEERKAARAQEMQALEEAEEIIRKAFFEKGSLLQSSLRGTSRHH